MAKVRRTDIVDDTLYVTTQKTNDRLPINLNSFAKEILEKYKDTKFPGGLALPVITNQKMNNYNEMDRAQRLQGNETIHRHRRTDQGRGHEYFRERAQEIGKLRKSYNISGVDSVNLLRFKEFIYICTGYKT